MPSRLMTYAVSTAIGVGALLLVMTPAALLGAGPGWDTPIPDQAQTLSAHLALQADQWRWPLLITERLFWPRGVSVALADANPLVSLLAKAWVRGTGAAPMNWLGAFLGLCWVLQAVAATYAARGLNLSAPAAMAAAALAVCCPALIRRMEHINLCGHALILLALGLAFRRIGRTAGSARDTVRRWAGPAAVMSAAALTHPYLFQLCAAVLAAVPLEGAVRRRPGWWRDAAGYGVGGVAAVGLLLLLAGPLSGGDKGFVVFSMNLLSPVWPQRSGVFGAALPILDATGGQYEGFNWMGAGVLLLLTGGVAHAMVARRLPRAPAGLVMVLGGLALLSLSSQVHAGRWLLLDLGVKPWEDVFGMFRVPGRAFWPVGYGLMLAGVAAADRMRRPVGMGLLAIAIGLQLVDVRPLQREARGWWEHGFGLAMPQLPAGTRVFGVAPFPGCTPDRLAKEGAPLMLLDAVRHGAVGTSIGLGRSPAWFSCERVRADALELPLLPGEVRAFFLAALGRPPALGPLGADAVCRRQPGVMLCGRDVGALAGEAVADREAPGLLASGWVRSGAEAWSEGPFSGLLLPAGTRRVRLRLAGVATVAGGSRAVMVTVGRGAPQVLNLIDGAVQEVVLDVPEGAAPRVSLETIRPVDPARRGLAAPVRRAAVRLLGVWREDGDQMRALEW